LYAGLRGEFVHADDHGMLRVFRVHAAASDTDARRCDRKGPNDLVVLHLLSAGDVTLRFYCRWN
jgi:hypothetical protein